MAKITQQTEQQMISSEQVLQTIKEMRNRLEALNREKTEPIAIIGLGCRFPGNANNPEAFWSLLQQGIDVVGEVPPGRWNVDDYYDPNPETPGKTYTKQGGFLQQVDQFDPLFFGISPREAASLDPQQRLLLEVTWEALENAGQTPTKLRHSQTGIYVGICTDDYRERFTNLDNLSSVDAHSGTGNARSMAVGRISHFLGLQGPNIQLDTACSSSLVTVHLACQSLRLKECNLALAGGVNLILSPVSTIGRCQLKALAPDGRCKTFDASADGYGQGEGCGMVVLKRLSDAIADGDTILAVIRGSAINHDGPSSGLTVPNKMAQKDVIQQALKNAKVEPHQVNYVEAHGTGTSLGDPIELESLATVYGQNRPINQPLVVGSVKTNFGHLEAAAGISGLIKIVLSLQNQEIPPHLHLKTPNPHIPWHQLPLVIPTSCIPWNRGNQPRIAGISAFGISGTNVHLILEEAPEPVKTEKSLEPKFNLLTFSAKTQKALEELRIDYVNYLQNHPELELGDICYTVNAGRSHFNHRLAVIASNKIELTTKLKNLATNQEISGVFSGQISSHAGSPKIAFLFTGQGSQFVNMGLQLYQTQPTFRKALDQCDEILRPYLEIPLLQVLYPTVETRNGESLLDQTIYTQPALFAIEYALAQLWQSWGIKPDAVMGHSVGEYVAATVAGVFSLEAGLKLVATRGKLMQQLPTGSEMVSVLATESQIKELITPYNSQVNIAAINGPESVVISGLSEAIQEICSRLTEMGIKTKPLQVSHAFHSPLMEPMLAEFELAAKEVTYNQPGIPLISNVTGQLATQEIATPEYWVNHIRQPVRFSDGMQTLDQQGYKLFLEIGAKPILLGMGRQCLPEKQGIWLPSLRPPQEDWQQIISSLGQLYIQGVAIDWSGFNRDYSCHKVALPTYPFQRQRYWWEIEKNQQQPQDETVSTPIINLLNQGATQQLVQEVELAGELTEQERQLLPKLLELLVKRQQNYLEFKGGTVHEYYNAVATLGQEQVGSQTDGLAESPYLTFGLFPEKVPGFSWIKCLTEANQEQSREMIVESQKELRKLLFALVDFSKCQKVLDFGCGYGSDLIQLAERYEHLQLTGYTISSEQAKFALQRVTKSQLQERVKIFNRDSAKDNFTDLYDLVFGFEVSHHILDKKSLFANIGNHLNDQGYLVLADFISNSDFAIDHQETSSYFITKSEWVELLSEHQLQLVGAIDVSPEISNFLYDPDFEQHLEQLYQKNRDENVKSGFKSYYQLGKVLSKELASYVLLTAQKQQHLSKQEIAEWNQQMLAQLSSYSEVTPQRWLYELKWQPQKHSTPPEQTPARITGNWLLFIEAGAVATELKQKLAEKSVIVSPGLSYKKISAKHYQINPTIPEDFKQLLQDILAQDLPLQGIVHLWSLSTSAGELETALEYSCGSLLHLVQALIQIKEPQIPPLWVVTQSAGNVQQTPVWGLGRVVTLEHPELQCRLLDLPADIEAEEVAKVLYQELTLTTTETQISYTQDSRQVARLVRREPQAAAEKRDINIVPEASYLITGGLGALGLQTAKWLVDKGAKYLVLVGRKEPSEKARQTIAQLEQLGVQVSVLLADISVAEDVANLFKQIQVSLPPLRGVIHAAGVLDDGVLQQMNWQRFVKVMAPKVQGAWHLHQLTQELPLDFFVCFSSAASVLGSTGQGNYAAANAFLDGLVHYRRSLGLPGLSINWGAWAETGMASRLASQFQSRIRSLGMGSILPEQGLQILTQLLEEAATQVTVVPIDWDRFTATLPSGMKLPILEEMECYYRQDYRQDACSTEQTEHNPFLLELKTAKQGDRTQLMTNYLQSLVAKLLGYPDPEMLDSQLGFFDMGMDSLLSLELRNLLQTRLGCAVSATVLFEYTNIEALAEYLTTEVLAEKLEATIQNTDSQQIEQPSVSGEEVTDAIAQKFQQIQNLLNQGL
ncbi:type I polyketide synthase [Planktothrix pseudagardhii]|uniref:Phenolphthiocerol synthesis polyketide synthase type I Pks15/1 n=1 Tax=Planktothrix pseudagardhii TaxID=132604 RepID=A0A9W4CQ19_9CYAN|nr:type I polyketide synthase [Planktothrix pseudagardhii]CAD5970615.1 Phenolphthiocerol synthesis polyketide synthase type I Pks15/1 [Planktothrix pseudagardhii]